MKINKNDINEWTICEEIDTAMSWLHIRTNPKHETRGKVNLYRRLDGVKWDTHIGCLLRAIPFTQHAHKSAVGETLHALIFNGEGGEDLLNILVAPSMSTCVPNYYQYGCKGNRVFIIAKDLSRGFVDFAIEFDSEDTAQCFAYWFASNTGLNRGRFDGDIFDHRGAGKSFSPFTIVFERFAEEVQNHVASQDDDTPPVLPNPNAVELKYLPASDYTSTLLDAKDEHKKKLNKLVEEELFKRKKD